MVKYSVLKVDRIEEFVDSDFYWRKYIFKEKLPNTLSRLHDYAGNLDLAGCRFFIKVQIL